jgi:GMP synthase PP-ATPase subunit
LDTLREADWIVIDEIKGGWLYRSLWQSFAILTPVRERRRHGRRPDRTPTSWRSGR